MSEQKKGKLGKVIIFAILGMLILIIASPLMILAMFLPSLEASVAEEYKEIGKIAYIEWSDMIIYDTVRYDNDFSLANVSDTAFEFLVVKYIYREEREECIKKDEDGKCIESETYWVTVEDKTLQGKNQVLNQLKRVGYNTSNWTIKEAIETLDRLNNSEGYSVTYANKDIEDMVQLFDEEQEEWANMLITEKYIFEMFGETYDLPDHITVVGTGLFAWPTPTLRTITSHYGWRIHPKLGTRKFHYGMDTAGSNSMGQPIVSIADGVVNQVVYGNNIAGNNVRIDHTDSEGNTWQSRYSHMSQITVRQGQVLKQGDVIGAVGNTGLSTGAHLHLELKFNGQYVDPYIFVKP